jgi:predicted GNAT family N-acyltransferase
MTYVWTREHNDRVVAYYSITPHQVVRDEVSSGMAGGVSVIPAYLLARLALDGSLHGQGLGGELLHDALDRILSATSIASGRLVVVDAIDEHAAAVYRYHDFRPLKSNPLRLVMKVSTLQKTLRPLSWHRNQARAAQSSGSSSRTGRWFLSLLACRMAAWISPQTWPPISR